MPHSEVVNAAIARARGRVNGYPDRHAGGIRRLLAERHAVAPEQVVLGNGAAELLQVAALALLSAGDELVMPWPSYPLYPLMAARARAKPVSVATRATTPTTARPAGAITERTRALVICNPNDPTGHYLPAAELGACSPCSPSACTCSSTRRWCTSRTPRSRTPACGWWTPSRGCWWCAPSRRSTGCPASAPATPWARTPTSWARSRPCWA